MCKGTTNGEDVYLIKKELIPQETLTQLNEGWINYQGGIPVDLCIGKEVEELIIKGIVTVGSCCGHDRWESHVLIPHHERDGIEKNGYITDHFNDLYLMAYLKSGTNIS